MSVAAALMAGQALGNLYASEQGRKERQGDRREERIRRDNAINYIKNVEDPELKAQYIEQYKNVYNFTPEDIQTVQLGPSEMQDVQADPVAQQAQMDALAQLSQYTTGELTDADVGMMQEAQSQASMADRGRQEAILQGLARRGMAGGGQELAARLSSSQQAANQGASAGRDMQNMAQQRALAALSAQGSLAGNIRGQSFGEDSARAQATDAISRFNAANQQNVLGNNVSARNASAQQAAANRQNLSNQNTDLRNQDRGQHNQIEQQTYNNEMNQAVGMAGQNVSLYENNIASGKLDTEDRGRSIDSMSGAGKFIGGKRNKDGELVW